MITLSPPDIRCRVFTFGEGALKGMTHDLTLEAEDVRMQLAEDLSSLEVECGARSLRLLHPEMSERDTQKIHHITTEVVLAASKHPRIRFVSTEIKIAERGYALKGVVALHGAERPLSCDVLLADGVLTAAFTLRQTDFGITPYSAMLGALRVRNEVRVELEVSGKSSRSANLSVVLTRKN